ncbi:hypothetical protein COU20_04020 [Candidatus Kaiserbacteria bacterium CG10_big_fil_rev_8_21_14_0_10_59_10]|uniref:Peptidoglycan binding-like domain-containing protein n=1 Tax=Candidatus Kaiserbacteria bacterium CG10_big_fil_rev_8_21_14_0_10_59_10 TaxID=1974612 RepID=A0A2H0U8Y6_9BACT|nr:MAG: hypothetical protein COU20_04020 [Candidatus Kaiserbacteria bacterium CG10_big_fil_rev_8_21_14_0_10_59_10]
MTKNIVRRKNVFAATAAGVCAFLFAVSPASAQTQEQLATLQNLLTSLQQVIAQVQERLQQATTTPGIPDTGAPATATVNVPSTFRFNQDLRVGSSGTDVLYLQRILNAYPASRLANTGPGSPGQETSMFGPLTEDAVTRFQIHFAADILHPLDLTTGTGFVGPSTRAKLDQLIAGGFPIQ